MQRRSQHPFLNILLSAALVVGQGQPVALAADRRSSLTPSPSPTPSPTPDPTPSPTPSLSPSPTPAAHPGRTAPPARSAVTLQSTLGRAASAASTVGPATTVPTGFSDVYVRGTQLMVRRRQADGSLAEAQPYLVKGVTWSPATRAPRDGPDPRTGRLVPYGFFFDGPWRAPGLQGYELLGYWQRARFAAHYAADLALIAQMHANTVRVYTDLGNTPAEGLRVLDECYRRGIMVILTVASAKEDVDSGRYLELVKRYKDHPAILMWSLGNEWNLNRYFGYTIDEAIRATDSAAQTIKQLDRMHPVTSSLSDRFTEGRDGITWIVRNVPSVDVWGLNVYRGASFGNLFSQWNAITTKPCYLSEFGTDSFFTQRYKTVNGFQADDVVGQEDRPRQAEYVLGLWKELKLRLSALDPTKRCLGGAVHTFQDALYFVGSFHFGLGGLVDYDGPDRRPGTADDDTSYDEYNPEGLVIVGGHPDHVANEEYFGLVDADRNPKPAYTALQQLYAQLSVPPTVANRPPVLEPIPNQTARVGEAKTFPGLLRFSDPDGQVPTFVVVSGGPNGLVVRPTPTVPGVADVFWPAVPQPGTWTLTAIVPDPQEGNLNGPLAARRQFTVSVQAANRPPIVASCETTEDASLMTLSFEDVMRCLTDAAVSEPSKRRLVGIRAAPTTQNHLTSRQVFTLLTHPQVPDSVKAVTVQLRRFDPGVVAMQQGFQTILIRPEADFSTPPQTVETFFSAITNVYGFTAAFKQYMQSELFFKGNNLQSEELGNGYGENLLVLVSSGAHWLAVHELDHTFWEWERAQKGPSITEALIHAVYDVATGRIPVAKAEIAQRAREALFDRHPNAFPPKADQAIYSWEEVKAKLDAIDGLHVRTAFWPWTVTRELPPELWRFWSGMLGPELPPATRHQIRLGSPSGPPPSNTPAANRPPTIQWTKVYDPGGSILGFVTGRPITFEAQATDPDGKTVTYTWDFGDQTTATGSTVQHPYARPGSYTVTLRVSDGQSTATKSIPITVQATNPPPVAGQNGPQPGVTADSSLPQRKTTPTRQPAGRDPARPGITGRAGEPVEGP